MSKKRRRHCGCKGRSGKDKLMHGSRQKAVTGTLRQGKAGAFRTYRCPKVKGVWHTARA